MEFDRLKAIYEEASALDSAEARAAFLEKACGDDAGLRQEVESLLSASARVEGFLDGPLIVPSPTASEVLGTRIGHYRLLEQIGEGGFGSVYMAEQEEPVRRKVALKIIKAGMDTKHVIARFEAERQALAMMDHPNIAKVLDAGETESGRPYFVMELVKGIPITDFCQQKGLSPRTCVELCIRICSAVQHAHQKGIIHRDLKPSNVMITMVDGQPVPKVIDFGVAKALQQRLTDKTLFTRYDQLLGTPAYMSPEQAELSGQDVDTRSDIYSLGCLLYELLTGTAPIEKQTLRQAGLDEIRRLIRETDPPKPSTRLREKAKTRAARAGSDCAAGPPSQRVEPGADAVLRHQTLSRELDCVVMKCLEKDRNRRYETANGLAMDLQRHLNDEPVLATPPSRVYRVQKFVRRHRLQVAFGISLSAAMVFGLIFTLIGFAHARRERDRALSAEHQADAARIKETEARFRSEEEELRTRRFLYVSDMNEARVSLDEGNLRRAVELLDRYRPGPGETDLRGWEWRYLWLLSRSDELFSLGSHSNCVKAVAFSPDGKRIASGGYGSLLCAWDYLNRKLIKTISAESRIEDLAFSPDGKILAVAEKKGLAIRDGETFELRTYIPKAKWPIQVRFSPDGRRLAVLYAWDQCAIYDAQRWQELVRFQTRPSELTYTHSALAFSPDGGALAVAEGSGRILLVDSKTGEAVARWQSQSNAVYEVAFAPDGQTLASVEGRIIRLWRVSTGEPIWSRTNHTEWISKVAFSPDGQTLASASADQSVRLWDAASGHERARLQGNLEEFWTLAWSPDGKNLVTGGKDGAVKLWSAAPEEKKSGCRLVQENAGFFDFVSNSSTLLLWPRELKNQFLFAGFPLALSPDLAFTAFAGGSNPGGDDLDQLYVMVTETGRVELVGQHPERIDAIAFAPDGQVIAASSGAAGVWLWDTASRRKVATLGSGLRILRILSLAFSPDGQRLATASWNGMVQLWDLATLQPVLSLNFLTRGRDAPVVERLRFSLDGEALVALLDTGQCYLWQVPSMEAINRTESPGAILSSRHAAFADLPTIPLRPGIFVEAEELQRNALEKLLRLEKVEEPAAADFILKLGAVLDSQGRFAESERLSRNALELFRQRSGELYGISQALNNLACALASQGTREKLEEAEALHREGLDMDRAVIGSEHPMVARTLRSLAYCLIEQRKSTEAEALLREALATTRKVANGQDNPGLAELLDILGMTLWKQDKSSEAEALLREALEIRQRMHGAEHASVGDLLNALGLVLGEQRKLPEAEAAFLKSIAISRKLANERPAALHNLAWVLREQGKLSDAEAVVREALAIEKRLRGEKNPNLIYILNLLAALLRQQGKFSDAEELNLQAVEIARASLDKDHEDYARAINVLAGTLQQRGKFAAAEPLRREVLELRLAQFAGDSKQVSDAKKDLGWLLFEWAQTDASDSVMAAARKEEGERLLNEHGADMRRRYMSEQPDQESYKGKLWEFAVGLHWARGPAAALAFLQEATQKEPENPMSWLMLGIYQLFCGDPEGYQQTCREMLRHYAETQDLDKARKTVKTWHLLPQQISPEEEARLEKLMNVFARIENPWHRLTASLHHLRCGRPSEALAQLRHLPAECDHNIQAAAQAVAALSHHAMGQLEAAHKELGKAMKPLRKNWPDPFSESPPYLHHDAMVALMLYREAKVLVEPSSVASSSTP